MNLLVHGWRAINHSFSMVNQNQLVYLSALPDVHLVHEDAPLFKSDWSEQKNSSGFSAEFQSRIRSIASPNALDPIDWAYSIVFPFVYYRRPLGYPQPQRVATFMVTEFGLAPDHFQRLSQDPKRFTQDGSIVITPSNWSRDRLVESGLDADGVVVVPHGVDHTSFNMFDDATRATLRTQLGFDESDFVFMNLGAMTWNKGIDLLLQAFFTLAQKHKHIKLVLKDQSNLYGMGAQALISRLAQEGKISPTDDSIKRLLVNSDNLSVQQLASLYNVADCYVSPYYAEGFNLPVAEAGACGTRLIVTSGGATDDFCPDDLVQKVEARFVRGSPRVLNGADQNPSGGYASPDLEDLYQKMGDTLQHPAKKAAELSSHLHLRFSWEGVCKQLGKILDGKRS